MNPIPLSVGEELHRDFDEFHETVRSWDHYDRTRCAELHQRATELSKTDVEAGNLLLAKLGSVLGNSDEVERWCRNLEHHNFRDAALHMRFQHFVNSGQATKGQEIFSEVVARRNDQNLVHILHGAIAIGAFNAASEALRNSNMRKENIGHSDFIEKIKSNHPAVVELGLEDFKIAKMFDEAGAILREVRMNWSSYDLSIIALTHSSGGPAVSVEWQVSLSPTEAACLTWKLTDRLVEKELDFPGFSLGFLGVELQ